MKLLDEILEHYGTKGMKWGVRKGKVPKQGPSDDAKEAHKAFVKAKTSGPESLTNRELTALNNRLNLEMNYDRLSYNPGKLKKGLDQVSQMLKAGNTINDAVKFAQSPVGKKLASSIKSKPAKTARASKEFEPLLRRV